jgi:hypothetical protein
MLTETLCTEWKVPPPLALVTIDYLVTSAIMKQEKEAQAPARAQEWVWLEALVNQLLMERELITRKHFEKIRLKRLYWAHLLEMLLILILFLYN